MCNHPSLQNRRKLSPSSPPPTLRHEHQFIMKLKTAIDSDIYTFCLFPIFNVGRSEPGRFAKDLK